MFSVFNRFVAIFVVGVVCLGSLSVVSANVVRPAEALGWVNAAGTTEDFQKLRGHSVLLFVVTGPRNWTFRSQIGQLQKVYQRLADTKTICVVAFTKTGGVVRSNIPFVLAQDGPQVAARYGLTNRFTLLIIGRDGNVDFITSRVLTGQRILDIIGNSFAVQESLRRN